MEYSCKTCKKRDTCNRPIRKMASEDELEFIVCIEWEVG